MQLTVLTFELPEVLADFTDTPAPFLGTMSSRKVDLFKPGSGGQALLRVQTSPTPCLRHLSPAPSVFCCTSLTPAREMYPPLSAQVISLGEPSQSRVSFLLRIC